MAQVISIVCDQHQQRDELVPGRTYQVGLTLPGAKAQAWDVDLCDDCAKALTVVHDFLVEVGRAPAKPARRTKAPASAVAPPKPGPVPSVSPTSAPGQPGGDGQVPAATDGSPVADRTCPACGTVSASKGGLDSHARNVHQQSLPELRGEPLPHLCPECGRGFSAAHGLGAHRHAAHGVAGTSKGSSAGRSSGAPS